MHKKDDIVKIYDDMFNLIGAEKWSVVHEQGLLPPGYPSLDVRR